MADPKDIKVGDVVAWADVPDGALVRHQTTSGGHAYLLVSPSHVCAVRYSNAPWLAPPRALLITNHGGLRQAWDLMLTGQIVTIIALSVPADATAEDLRALAERFEVREYLSYGDGRDLVECVAWPHLGDMDGKSHREIKDRAADVLYRAGWRKGMTAEDAARRLAEAE